MVVLSKPSHDHLEVGDFVRIVDARALMALEQSLGRGPWTLDNPKPYMLHWISLDRKYGIIEHHSSVLCSSRDKPPLLVKLEYVSFAHRPKVKEGDRVRLTKTPEVSESSGWKGSSHFLVEGALATIKGIGFQSAYLEFDEESYIHFHTKEVIPVSEDRHHLFWFGEDFFEREITNETSSL